MERTAPPKPQRGIRKREKARAKRQEAAHAKRIRAACVERDGRCAIATRLGWRLRLEVDQCLGVGEWAHVGPYRRCHTRGQQPEERHTTAGSAILCKHHHEQYDAHEIDFQIFESERGMDGPFAVIRRAA